MSAAEEIAVLPAGVPHVRHPYTVGMIDCDPFQIHFAAYFRWADPLRYGDGFTATSWIGETGRSSYVVIHSFEREGELMAQARCTHVWTTYGPPQAPAPLPRWVLEASG